jgi:hypothetical protein
MNAKRTLPSAVQSFISRTRPAFPYESCELSERESDDAFKVVVTLREAIEAADSVARRLEGTSDLRYATFLAKARERHLQIAENARGLLIEMIVGMSGEVFAKGHEKPLSRRSS